MYIYVYTYARSRAIPTRNNSSERINNRAAYYSRSETNHLSKARKPISDYSRSWQWNISLRAQSVHYKVRLGARNGEIVVDVHAT